MLVKHRIVVTSKYRQRAIRLLLSTPLLKMDLLMSLELCQSLGGVEEMLRVYIECGVWGTECRGLHCRVRTWLQLMCCLMRLHHLWPQKLQNCTIPFNLEAIQITMIATKLFQPLYLGFNHILQYIIYNF